MYISPSCLFLFSSLNQILYFMYSWKQKELYVIEKSSLCHYKTGKKETLPVAFYPVEFHGDCQHLLDKCGFDQSIFSKESQLKPGSKVFKKQSKQNIQFAANFSASLSMSEVKKFSSGSHYLWIANKENIKSNKHKATHKVAQINSYEPACNLKADSVVYIAVFALRKNNNKKTSFYNAEKLL